MPAIIFWAIMIYEAIFAIRLIRVTKTYREQQTEDAKKAVDRETLFLMAGAAVLIVIRMIF